MALFTLFIEYQEVGIVSRKELMQALQTLLTDKIFSFATNIFGSISDYIALAEITLFYSPDSNNEPF